MSLRCLIVDDSPEFLRAARDLLEQEGITVVGVAETGPEALTRARDLRPDVALVDIYLGATSGFDLVRELADEGAAIDLILVSTHAQDEFTELIERSPAAGFIPKSDIGAQAIEALLG